jgi:purine-nucleoside phosphorylase
MKKLPDYFQLERFNISPADVIRMGLHCDPDSIHPDVILMPWWQPEIFALWSERITAIAGNTLFEMEFAGKRVSIVRSGIGAPQTGDTVLALGLTACERIFFAGSVGGLRPDIHIGDLMIPEYSVSGDGFCRYLQPGFPEQDHFLEHVLPDEALTQALARSAAPLARQAGVTVHTGPVFSIDTILAQFDKLDYIVEKLGCIGIEMETAAVFKAARLVGIRAAALFSVSDVPVRNESLLSGRSQEEQEHRRVIRKQVLAKALLDAL